MSMRIQSHLGFLKMRPPPRQFILNHKSEHHLANEIVSCVQCQAAYLDRVMFLC